MRKFIVFPVLLTLASCSSGNQSQDADPCAKVKICPIGSNDAATDAPVVPPDQTTSQPDAFLPADTILPAERPVSDVYVAGPEMATSPDTAPIVADVSPEIVTDASPTPDTTALVYADAAFEAFRPDVFVPLDSQVLIVPVDATQEAAVAAPPDVSPDVFVSTPDVFVADTQTSNADTGPVCKVAEGYSLCGTDNNGCCSAKYANTMKDPITGYVSIGPNGYIKSESSPQVYATYSTFMLAISAKVILGWTTSCTDLCLGVSPTSANGCYNSGIIQLSDADFAVEAPFFTFKNDVQIPFRPGTTVLVYKGDKYVSSGQGAVRQLRKLVPPSLEDKIFPGTAAAREQTVDDAYVAMYTMGTDITDASQYKIADVCSPSILRLELDQLAQ